MPRDPRTVAVLMFDATPMFETSVPLSVFGVDRTSSGAPAFTLLVVSAEPGPLSSTGGLLINAPCGLADLHKAGVIIVPGWRDPLEDPPNAVLKALQHAHADGAIVMGLCMGAFVLAAAGLLDGRRAVTHWVHADTLAARYPHVTVDASVLYVDDGEILTSAGTAAGLDACLHLVRRIWGAAAAATIARRMVIPPQRSGGQAQYIDREVPATRDHDALASTMAYALEHLAEHLDMDALAAHANTSRRTFDRQFRVHTGQSPLQWLLHQRVLRAQHLLEQTDLTIDAIANQVGLANAVSLRPHFRRVVGVSPQQYRATFHARDSIAANVGAHVVV